MNETGLLAFQLAEVGDAICVVVVCVAIAVLGAIITKKIKKIL